MNKKEINGITNLASRHNDEKHPIEDNVYTFSRTIPPRLVLRCSWSSRWSRNKTNGTIEKLQIFWRWSASNRTRHNSSRERSRTFRTYYYSLFVLYDFAVRAKRRGRKRRRRIWRRRKKRRRIGSRADPLSFVPFGPFDRARQRQKAACVLFHSFHSCSLFRSLSLSLSPSLAFLSVLPHLGRGPSTVCDPRPTFSSSIRTAYHHYHRVSSHLLQPRAATFYFFIFFFLNFYYYYYYFFFFFFFFFFLFFAVVVVTAVVVVIIDAVSFFNSVSSSSSCFSSLIPLQTHVVVSATPIDAPTTDPRPPAFPELFSRAAPIRPRRISGTEERTLDKRKLDGPVRSRAVSRWKRTAPIAVVTSDSKHSPRGSLWSLVCTSSLREIIFLSHLELACVVQRHLWTRWRIFKNCRFELGNRKDSRRGSVYLESTLGNCNLNDCRWLRNSGKFLI